MIDTYNIFLCVIARYTKGPSKARLAEIMFGIKDTILNIIAIQAAIRKSAHRTVIYRQEIRYNRGAGHPSACTRLVELVELED